MADANNAGNNANEGQKPGGQGPNPTNMAEQSPDTAEKKSEVELPTRSEPDLPNVVVECGDIKNRTITIDTWRLRLRGHTSMAKLMGATGRNVGTMLAPMPDIPGIRIAVYFKSSRIRIYDPLNNPDNKELLERINTIGRSAKRISSGDHWVGIKDVENIVNNDEMKTFLLEILMHLGKEEPTMRVVAGTVPEREVIDKLPGKQLYDPWSNSEHRPKYVEDVETWSRGLAMQQE